MSTSVSSQENPTRLPGQYYDGESGLHYNYFRDYDPSLGRYVQSDPIGLNGGLNSYVYAANQPTINVDPKGDNPFLIWLVRAGFFWICYHDCTTSFPFPDAPECGMPDEATKN